MNLTRLFSYVLSIGCIFVVVGCGKKQVRQTPLQKSQSVYTATLNHYYQEIEMLKNEAHLKKENVTEQIIESMCSKSHKNSQGAPLHSACERIKQDVEELRFQVKKLSKNKKMSPLEVADAKQLIQQINNLTDRLYDIRLVLSSNKEYREETRYLNQLGAQASPLIFLRLV